jgi:hypothetical protein
MFFHSVHGEMAEKQRFSPQHDECVLLRVIPNRSRIHIGRKGIDFASIRV